MAFNYLYRHINKALLIFLLFFSSCAIEGIWFGSLQSDNLSSIILKISSSEFEATRLDNDDLLTEKFKIKNIKSSYILTESETGLDTIQYALYKDKFYIMDNTDSIASFNRIKFKAPQKELVFNNKAFKLQIDSNIFYLDFLKYNTLLISKDGNDNLTDFYRHKWKSALFYNYQIIYESYFLIK